MVVDHTAWADTVWLDNGDRLTGTIESLDNGVLLVHTDYGGDMRITFKNVKTLQSTTALEVHDKSLEHDYLAKLESADKGNVVLNGIKEEEDKTSNVNTGVPLTGVESIIRPHPLIGTTLFSGKLDVALAQTTASTNTQNYNVALHAEARKGRWRNTFDGSYNRATSDGSIGTNNYGLNYTLDRFITQKAFWEGRVLHDQDWVEQVRQQTAYGTGPGYQFWDDEQGAFSLAALLGRIHYAYNDGTDTSSYAGSVRWNYAHYFSAKRYEIYTTGELLRPFSNGAKIDINGEVGARYNINQTMSLYVKYARDQVSGARLGLNQSIYGAGLGVSW